MQFELAATDASQLRQLQSGGKAGPGTGRRPAPFAAKLEIARWLVTGIAIPIKVQTPNASREQILNRKS